jgi:hypothetical protein
MIEKSHTTTSRRKTMPAGPARHAHSRAHCIKVLRRLSEFLDNDLSTGICKEIRKHLAACPNCEIFVDSLRQTINLCRHAAPPRLSPASKARIRSQILRAIGHS